MTTNQAEHRSGVCYEADERPPIPLTFGLGLQLAILAISGIAMA